MKASSKKRYADLESWFRDTTIPEVRRGPVEVDEWFQGRYEVFAVLGYGHTSVVFHVTDTKLQRTVALKMWHNAGHGIDDSVLLREGRLLASLKHPNVVKVYDYGTEDADHRPWTILEYLGPLTLCDILREKGCFAGQGQLVASIGQQVASIVDYLHHSAKLFQLDLKPGNLAFNVQTTAITLMDLGSAYQATSDHFGRYGTPGYIAPEVFQGMPVSESCDLFSLGMLLYEIITGHNPLIRLQRTALDVVEHTDAPISVAISSITRSVPVPELESPPGNALNIRRMLTGPDMEPRVAKTAQDHTAAIPIDAPPLSFPPTADWQPRTHRQRRYLGLLKAMRGLDLQQRLQELATPTVLCELVGALTRFDPGARPGSHEVQTSLVSMADGNGTDVMPSLFISHSHKDKTRFVTRFSETLKRRGFDVWLDDESLRAGDPFWERIAQAIESCTFVIVLLSENSVSSLGVTEEIRTAQLQNLNDTRLLPIRIDPIKFESIPRVLRSRHVLDFVGWDQPQVFQEKMGKLVADIMALHADRMREGEQEDGRGR